ncbi:DNA methylase N-4 [Rhodobacterales bacterium 52_120_T64]|nr:DNA methylase N-4 [Rhodobacterales bacterium 52_120_T64]
MKDVSIGSGNQIHHRNPSGLKPWKKNARKHSKKQLKQIAQSIEEFGFTNPILIDQTETILAGHGRVEAAKLLQLDQVPCLYIEHLSSAQKRAYVLADNQIALNASWDEDLLGEELKALSEIDLGFQLEVTGFSIAEIDNLIDAPEPEDVGDPRDDALPKRVQSRVQLGDIWQLGNHRLICGDSLDPDTIDKLMEGQKAQMVFTDPPYNVKIDGHVGGNGKIKHEEFTMASGEMNVAEFTTFLRKSFKNLTRHSVEGAIHYICMDWRHMAEVMAAADGIYAELKNLIVWAKGSGGMGTFYRSRHELIFAYKHGTAPHINSFELGQHGRYRTNVWDYRAANHAEMEMHPTVKPVEMVADAIRDVSGRGDVVLDLFGGSGSTLVAAEKTGRRAFLCELDPRFCDVILTRWERFTKDDATLLQREVGVDE